MSITAEQRLALAELGYTDDAIGRLTPSIAAEIIQVGASPVRLPAKIAKFRNLNATTVLEHLETTWDEALDWLAEQPADPYAGDMRHPGWSPVRFDPPTRARAHVREAYALVLDYDRGADWNKIRSLWQDTYGLIYTTKSHGVDGDRFRVVLPLARPATADEYDRLWQWGARRSSNAGCEADKQAKDVSRFWYDPTPPIGGWKAERLHGKPINTDAVLLLVEPPALHVVSAPKPMTSDERVKRAATYLAKIPGAVSGDNGHTRTFNAVAHVMLGFDLTQDETRSLILHDYNPRCDPPWSEKEIEHKIDSVSKQCERPRGYLLTERPRITSTQQASKTAPPLAAEVSVDWASELLTKKDHTPKRAYHNVAVFVRHFPEYRGKWSLDTMTMTPWFNDAPIPSTLVHEIRAHADRRLQFTPSTADVEAAILAAAHDRPFHPIQKYLRSIDWDGVPRLSSMAHDYLGSDSPLHAEMVRRWMIGAAARALWPGVKLDTALMLVGAQGIGKSTFFSILGSTWHSDTFVDITNKDSFVQIHSAWIYELSELENVVTGRAESRLKAWLTSTHDSFRAPYQRTAERRARAVVICGTTNRARFLTDDTGSRRFWIVPVGQMIPRDLLTEMRDQLWAEAVCAAESREPWWLSEETERQREAANDAHVEEDAWSEAAEKYLEGRHETSVSDLLEHGLDVKTSYQGRSEQMRAARILRSAGWERVRDSISDRESGWARRWKYVRRGSQAQGGLPL